MKSQTASMMLAKQGNSGNDVVRNAFESIPASARKRVLEGLRNYESNFSEMEELVESKGILNTHLAYMAQQGKLGHKKTQWILEAGVGGIQDEDLVYFKSAVASFNKNKDFNKALPDEDI